MSYTATNIEQKICYHCGEKCDSHPVIFDDKFFCCTGCKTAYQIINDNGLCTYYDIDTQAGISLKNIKSRNRFEYLEDSEVLERISDFKSNTQLSATLYIPNIHCASCVWLLENLHKVDGGVKKSTINFLKRELTVLINTEETSLRKVVELLTTIGYEPEIRLNNLYSEKKSNPNRSLWLKLGLAGFSFGNIMLFSFPDYLNTTETGLSTGFRIIFGTLNIVLALPVLLYSSSDYLKSAFAAISQGGINLDVPISIGILALFTRSVYEIVTGTGTGYMDSFTGLIFFLLIGKMLQKKTFDVLSFDRDYKSYLPIAVNTVDGLGNEKSVPLNRLEVGHEVRLRNQELVPSDSTLLSDEAFIDYSFITGEEEPIIIKKGELVFAGGKIVGTSVHLKIEKQVENSYLTKLWNNEAFQSTVKETGLTTFADRISPYFTYTVLGIAFISAFLWLGHGYEQALTVFTSVLIIACPCALALSTPFTLGSALNVFSINGLFIKNSLLIEQLAKATTLVFDKTGTLTNDEEAETRFHGTPLTEHKKILIKSACIQSVHPMNRKIAAYLKADEYQPDSFFEVLGKGIFSKQGSNILCLGSKSFLLEQTQLTEDDFPNHNVEGSLVYLAINNKYEGFFAISLGLRKGLQHLLLSLKSTFKTFLISGDNNSQIDLYTKYFSKNDALLFNQTPEDKLNFITRLQEEGEHVVMIGDGLNDAGALKKSNFGIALSDDISSFSPACDAIIEGRALSNLDQFIRFSKTSMNVIRISFGLSLLYNITGLGFAITGQLSPLVAAILMPISSVSVMVFTSIATRYEAKKTGLKLWK